ncbi:MAG: response regulator [Deltaproteobacteria bacterium]
MEKKTVLIVDDAIFMRMVLKKLFELDGRCEVIGEAQNGLEGIQKAEELQPDIITMDVVMPDLDGVEAVKEIKKLCPETKVVMITSVSNYQMVRKVIEIGAFDYLSKPIDLEDLNVLLEKIYKAEEDEKNEP